MIMSGLLVPLPVMVPVTGACSMMQVLVQPVFRLYPSCRGLLAGVLLQAS